jgi:hypothetical protein
MQMNIDSLSSILSNRSGIQQSVAGTILSTIINYAVQNLMQKGISSFLSSNGSDKSSLQSALSNLDGHTNDPNSPLVQQVKSSSGLRDNNQSKQYTQQAVELLKEHAGKDPQGLSSLLGSFTSSENQGQGGMGNIADLAGRFLGSNSQTS